MQAGARKLKLLKNAVRMLMGPTYATVMGENLATEIENVR